MNIRQLKQFISIAESGSISQSAKLENISQPALTRSIKNLEEELSAQLIERRSNGVYLTPYGEHLLEYARCIVNDSERVKSEILAMNHGTRGKIAIGVGPSFSTQFLSATLDKLLSRGTRVEVQLIEGFVEDLCASLRSGKLDVVFSLFPSSYDYSDLDYSKLCSVESGVIASANHHLAGKTNIQREQLAQCNWVIANQPSALAAFYEFLRGTVTPPQAQHIKANSFRLMKNLVLESDYLAILPKNLIARELQQRTLVTLDGPVKPLVTDGAVVTRKSGFKPAVLNEFIRIVKKEFQDTDYLRYNK